MAEPGIRDAVRELSRAALTLVRAVVGAVGRKQPAAAGPAGSGPPQAWLDLVAETDPDWLAGSRWAGRARRGRRSDRRQERGPARRRLTDVIRIEPDEDSPIEEPSTDDESVDAEPRGPREPRRASRRQSDGPSPVRPRSRRLVPVDLRNEAGSSPDDVPAPPVRRPAASRPHAAHLWDDKVRPVSTETERAPSQRPAVPTREAGLADQDGHDGAAQVLPSPEPRPYGPPTVLEQEPPGPTTGEPVRTGPERPRLVGPLEPVALEGHHPRRAPMPAAAPRRTRLDRPSEAPATWPELPRTDLPDEASASTAPPGLAALIWRTDTVPDTLTTAQRRS